MRSVASAARRRDTTRRSARRRATRRTTARTLPGGERRRAPPRRLRRRGRSSRVLAEAEEDSSSSARGFVPSSPSVGPPRFSSRAPRAVAIGARSARAGVRGTRDEARHRRRERRGRRGEARQLARHRATTRSGAHPNTFGAPRAPQLHGRALEPFGDRAVVETGPPVLALATASSCARFALSAQHAWAAARGALASAPPSPVSRRTDERDQRLGGSPSSARAVSLPLIPASSPAFSAGASRATARLEPVGASLSWRRRLRRARSPPPRPRPGCHSDSATTSRGSPGASSPSMATAAAHRNAAFAVSGAACSAAGPRRRRPNREAPPRTPGAARDRLRRRRGARDASACARRTSPAASAGVDAAITRREAFLRSVSLFLCRAATSRERNAARVSNASDDQPAGVGNVRRVLPPRRRRVVLRGPASSESSTSETRSSSSSDECSSPPGDPPSGTLRSAAAFAPTTTSSASAAAMARATRSGRALAAPSPPRARAVAAAERCASSAPRRSPSCALSAMSCASRPVLGGGALVQARGVLDAALRPRGVRRERGAF